MTTSEIDVRDPATGEVVGTVPNGGPAQAADAVAAAKAAAPEWARTSVGERAAALKACARRMEERADELAELVTREMGKPVGDARGGVVAGLETLQQYAELGPLHRGRSLVGRWGAADAMVHVPRGVAAVITPWNDPVAIACGLVGANLVAGNTVVFKPSERTPLSGVLWASLWDLPQGVLTCVTGDGALGAALVEHADVDLVCHVGSVATGTEIAASCARNMKKAVLELGGKDALIVDAGVDPAWAAEQAASGSFANAGQICTSVERIYVHADVAEAFVDELAKRADQLVVGNGLDPGTELGPLVDERQVDVVDGHVRDAVSRGAVVRAGGARLDRTGCFYPATVLTGVTDDMAVMRDETFGPVAPVRVVESFDEAIRLANSSEHGLAASVLTPSDAHAQQAWRELDVGTVKVNAVWGGAPGGAAEPHRHSGTGFGYGPELLDEVTRTRVVHLSPYEAG